MCAKCGYNVSYFAVSEEEFFEIDGEWYCLNCYEKIMKGKEILNENSVPTKK